MNNIEECNDSFIIIEILQKSFITVAKEFGFTKENAPTFSAFINKDKIDSEFSKGLKMYVYKISEKAVGTIGYIFENGKYNIERLSVLPEYRHKNIGKELMEFIENILKSRSVRVVKLGMVYENKKLLEWYLSLGYKLLEIKEHKDLIFKIGIMEKEIG
ncbi:MAG: GNAT family N-acetyltransferase [Sphingobacterium sp.]|jgi:ribosomal protein S18 acetylase RimI-like enzyme|nr:GNAT family N-acetyltransferase [Sphingobacterium sp.]